MMNLIFAREKERRRSKQTDPNELNVAPDPNRLPAYDGLRARKRWKALVGTITAEKSFLNESLRAQFGTHEGLLAEVKKERKEKHKVKESVLTLLQSQAKLTRNAFEAQKYSAKELIEKKRSDYKGSAQLEDDTRAALVLAKHNLLQRQKYPITPEIRAKLNEIKARNLEAQRKQEEKRKKAGFWRKLFFSTIIGQTLRADPRFYSMDIHDHLPQLCRRCRRPLRVTLGEGRFTVVGILFCILIPLLGILLLFGNREFNCVVCEERYVYGDFRARREDIHIMHHKQ